MRIFVQCVLLIFFVLTFVIFLVASTFRFFLLDYNFWTKSFEAHGVYQKLAFVVKDSVNANVDRQGGNRADLNVLTDLINTENTRDFVNNNLSHLLNFLDGKTPEMLVYVPLSKAPAGLLPKSISGLNEVMTLNEVSTRFNIIGLNDLPLNYISQFGPYSNYVFMGSGILLLVLFIFLVLAVSAGAKLIAPGLALLLSGLITIFVSESLKNSIKVLLQPEPHVPSIGKLIIQTTAPPLVSDLLDYLVYAGVTFIVIGIIFMFFNKWGRQAGVKIPLT